MKGWYRMDEGMVKVTGRDSRDFLHRMLSCHVQKLQPGQVIPGALLNALGRLLAPLWCWCVSDEEFLLQTPQDCLELLAERLDGYVFTEDVTVTRADGQFWLLLGDDRVLETDHFIIEDSSYVARQDEVVVWTTEPPLWSEQGYLPLTEAQAEAHRITQGRPRWGKELLDSLVPLGLGWDRALDHHKGCYTGQEVISRLTYVGHPQNQLIGLKLNELLTELPWDLQKDNLVIGNVTSCVESVTLGYLALARIRWQKAAPGEQVQLVFGKKVVNATVCSLPFDADVLLATSSLGPDFS